MRECPACFKCYDDSVNTCPVEGRPTFNSLPGDVALDGRYVLERRLGEGGMGVVYKAHHKFLKTTRAIKIIKPELVGNDSSFATRFQQEAMAAAAIGHPNIISVPDYGFLGGEIPFLVMEFVEGDSLQDLMTSEGRFSPERALEYMRVIASAVGAAHAHGIVHRDLKPLNIMLNRKRSPQEQIRILDFGLAKIKSADLFGSFVGAKTTGIIGSPYYMAPEQWSDDEPDKRCDIYSLGIILYQMLSGEVPFKGSSIPAVMKKHLMSAPPPLAVSGSGISEELEKVVYHALEKDPLLRTGSAEELIAELEQAVLGGAQGKARPRTRSRSKTRSAAARAKETEVARTTAEQMKATPEVKDVTRSTADHKEALELEPDPLDADIVIDDEKAAATIVSGAPVLKRSETVVDETIHQMETPTPAPQVEPPPPAPEPERQKTETPASGKQESQELDALRRATEEARRRAEERAFREIDESGELSGVVRTPSMPPRSVQPLSQPIKIEEKSEASSLVRKPLLIALSAVVVVTIIGVFAFAQLWSPVVERTPEQPVNPPTTGPPPRDMVLINGGSFRMGSDSAGEQQRGVHSESVGSFYMDKTEVTNADYSEFVKTGYRVPTDEGKAPWWKPWNGTDPPAGRERWPVSNVSAKDAEAYAQWLSKRDRVQYRLPTEAEWEFAARNGTDESLFPWGNSWDQTRANLDGRDTPVDVGSFSRGNTLSGLQDMVGNVWEWTSSKASYYDSRKVRAEAATAHVRRGGSFAERIKVHFYNATDRTWFGNEDYKFPTIGFRLVRDAK